MRYHGLVDFLASFARGSTTALCGSALLLFLACTPGTDPVLDGGNGEGGAITTFSNGGSDAGAGGQGGLPEGCEGISQNATYKPLNLYIMVDASSSMAGTKWTAAQEGLSAFLNDPTQTDIDVALSFFPRPADATPACDQMAYKEPVVPFGPLPDNADPIMTAFEAKSPDGFSSPMYPALGGAILEGIDMATQDPDEVSAVLLVTDGAPDGPGDLCSGVDPSDPANVAQLAAAGAGFDPAVKTFVVGLPGVDQAASNLIADAGGTDEAILVGTTDTANKFTEALVKARGELLACEFAIPPEVLSGEIGFGYVNVELTPGGGTPTAISQDPDCAGAGWKFDDKFNPSSIILCPETCDTIKDDPKAAIQIVLGCPTIE